MSAKEVAALPWVRNARKMATEGHGTWQEIGIERRAGTTKKRARTGHLDLGSRVVKTLIAGLDPGQDLREGKVTE